MRIAYITSAQIPSQKANSIQVMKVCQALSQNGHSVCLFVPGRSQANWDDLRKLYGLTIEFPIRWIPRNTKWRYLDFILRSFHQVEFDKFDLIYTRMVWVAWYAMIRRFPVIYESHDLPAGRIGTRLYRRFIHAKKGTFSVFITNALRKKIAELYAILDLDNTSIVSPDGVDLERYADIPDPTSCREKLNLPERFTAAYSGGFYPGRGVDFLFRLAQNFPKVQFLWIGGEDSSRKHWLYEVKNAGLNNVMMPGFIQNSELPVYQGAAEILIMPFGRTTAGSSGGDTAEICSPMKMFEYLASGRAILTSDLPVLREVLNDENAEFYLVENFESLVMHFKTLISDEKRRCQISENAKRSAESYDWKIRMQQIIAAAEAHLQLSAK